MTRARNGTRWVLAFGIAAAGVIGGAPLTGEATDEAAATGYLIAGHEEAEEGSDKSEKGKEGEKGDKKDGHSNDDQRESGDSSDKADDDASDVNDTDGPGDDEDD